MAISQPIATDKQNAPSHSLSHRVFANDSSADAKTIVASTGGKVGIGVDAPSAILHLKAGTAAASTGPLKFTAGTLLTSPEAGSLEFNDGRFYVTGTAKQRVIDRTSQMVNVADVTVTNTSTETTLYTWSLSANALKVGRIYKIHGDGIANNALSGDDLTFNLYFGGTKIGTYTPPTGKFATDAVWHMDSTITVRTVGEAGTNVVHADIQLSGVGVDSSTLNAIDTTQANTIVLKAKWYNVKTTNTVILHQAYLELKN